MNSKAEVLLLQEEFSHAIVFDSDCRKVARLRELFQCCEKVVKHFVFLLRSLVENKPLVNYIGLSTFPS